MPTQSARPWKGSADSFFQLAQLKLMSLRWQIGCRPCLEAAIYDECFYAMLLEKLPCQSTLGPSCARHDDLPTKFISIPDRARWCLVFDPVVERIDDCFLWSHALRHLKNLLRGTYVDQHGSC